MSSNPIKRFKYRVGASVRSYRRVIDQALREVAEGRRSAKDLPPIATAAKTGAELLLVEHEMTTMLGNDHEAPDHALGRDGGFESDPSRPHKQRKITVKEGVDKMGNAVDEVSVTVTQDMISENDASVSLVSAEAAAARLETMGTEYEDVSDEDDNPVEFQP